MSSFQSISIAKIIIDDFNGDQTLIKKKQLRSRLSDEFSHSASKKEIKQAAKAIIRDRKKGINHFSGPEGVTNLAKFIDKSFDLNSGANSLLKKMSAPENKPKM